MKMWIGNVAPGTSDDDIRAFVKKYAPALECAGIQRVEGDGSRPAAVLDFPEAQSGAIETVAMRLNGMYWKERQLFVQTVVR
jgi:hypothetical protein